ncbi:MAG: DUF1190 domain-containing protein, partial [Paracoccaceae bacterium]
MKRSSQITLRLMLGGAVMATLAACDDADVDGKVYGSLEACLDDGLFSDDICAAIVDEAQADHLISAPRYAEKDLCEDEFGLGLCTQEEVGRSSFWVPL